MTYSQNSYEESSRVNPPVDDYQSMSDLAELERLKASSGLGDTIYDDLTDEDELKEFFKDMRGE